MDRYTDYLTWTLSNFDFAMFILAVIFILLHRCIRRSLPEGEIVYRWIALFAVGFTGVYAFIFHAFFPEMAAAGIGWPTSPFQLEVGFADLALGILGILSFNANYHFRLATVIATACMLWGDALGHFYQLVKYHNYTPGNAGTWFWMDAIIPLILIICIVKLRRVRNH